MPYSPGAGGVAAVGVLGEVEQRAVVADRDVALAVGAGADLPVVGPAQAERPHRVAARDRGIELAVEIERDRAGDGERGVGDRVDRAGREGVVGRVDREAEQALDVVGVFAELAQVGGLAVEVARGSWPSSSRTRRSGWRRRPARRQFGMYDGWRLDSSDDQFIGVLSPVRTCKLKLIEAPCVRVVDS